MENINYYDALHLIKEMDAGKLYNYAWDICKIDRCDECDTTLSGMVSCYEGAPTEDLTLRVYDYEDEVLIVQTASGGGECRDMKEACRFAFMRLFVEGAMDYAEHATIEVSF